MTAAMPGQAAARPQVNNIDVTHDPEIPVQLVQLWLCDLCLDGEGDECHTPGCSLWIHDVPKPALRGSQGVTILGPALEPFMTPEQVAAQGARPAPWGEAQEQRMECGKAITCMRSEARTAAERGRPDVAAAYRLCARLVAEAVGFADAQDEEPEPAPGLAAAMRELVAEIIGEVSGWSRDPLDTDPLIADWTERAGLPS